MQLTITPDAFRNLVKQISGKEITSTTAATVLSLFESDLREHLDRAVKSFVIRHYGNK